MTVVVVAFLVAVVADAVGMAVEEDVVAFLVVADDVGMEEDVVDFHSYYQDVLHMVAVDPEDHPADLLAAAAADVAVDDEMVAVVDDADADY